MSFRVPAARSTRFDEDGMTGYSAGEDLDFSIRVKAHGSLIQAGGAQLRHRHPVDDSSSREIHLERWILSREYLVHKHPAHFRYSCFWFSVIVTAVVSMVRLDGPGLRATSRAMKRIVVSEPYARQSTSPRDLEVLRLTSGNGPSAAQRTAIRRRLLAIFGRKTGNRTMGHRAPAHPFESETCHKEAHTEPPTRPR